MKGRQSIICPQIWEGGPCLQSSVDPVVDALDPWIRRRSVSAPNCFTVIIAPYISYRHIRVSWSHDLTAGLTYTARCFLKASPESSTNWTYATRPVNPKAYKGVRPESRFVARNKLTNHYKLNYRLSCLQKATRKGWLEAYWNDRGSNQPTPHDATWRLSETVWSNDY